MRRIGIIQPNYIPWRGYFDFIREVDVFVFLDDVQYTTRDWRNRNRIRLRGGGVQWLTVPVLGGRNQLIMDVLIDNTQQWQNRHLGTLRHNYSQAPYFGHYIDRLESLYRAGYESLAGFDIALTREIAGWLGLETEFRLASEFGTRGVKDDKLLEIVRKLNGDLYLSGPAARDYIRPELWQQAGVALAYKDYSGYPDYPQITNLFEPAVSVLDLLFMTGPTAPDYIWGIHRAIASGHAS